MAEDVQTHTEATTNVQLVVDERDMKSTFANGYRIYTTGEEVVLDFGFNMLNPSQSPTGSAYFNCDGPTAVPGHYANLTQALANCPVGNRLGAIISAPLIAVAIPVPAEFVAPRTTLVVPVSAGVPLMIPVEGATVRPAGSGLAK